MEVFRVSFEAVESVGVQRVGPVEVDLVAVGQAVAIGVRVGGVGAVLVFLQIGQAVVVRVGIDGGIGIGAVVWPEILGQPRAGDVALSRAAGIVKGLHVGSGQGLGVAGCL